MKRTISIFVTLAGAVLFVVAVMVSLCGCATHRIPTASGDMVYMSLLYGREIPKGSYTITATSPTGVTTSTVINIEGYKGNPDKESIKVITDAIKALAEAAAVLAAK